MIKAEAVKKFCDENNIKKMIVADDGGLVVDALGGRPRGTFCKIWRRPRTAGFCLE